MVEKLGQYEPLDNDEDCIEFDVAKIEQMEVEFKICPICDGSGIVFNGIIYWRCFRCDGTGEVEKEANKLEQTNCQKP